MSIINNEKRNEVIRRLLKGGVTIKGLSEEFNVPASTIYAWARDNRTKENKIVKNESESVLKSKIEETILSYNAEINYCERRIRSVRYAMKSILLETKDTDDWDDDWDVTMGLVREYLRDYERLFEQRNDYIRKKGDLEYILKSTNIC